jgi:hypothetical protein
MLVHPPVAGTRDDCFHSSRNSRSSELRRGGAEQDRVALQLAQGDPKCVRYGGITGRRDCQGLRFQSDLQDPGAFMGSNRRTSPNRGSIRPKK